MDLLLCRLLHVRTIDAKVETANGGLTKCTRIQSFDEVRQNAEERFLQLSDGLVKSDTGRLGTIQREVPCLTLGHLNDTWQVAKSA